MLGKICVPANVYCDMTIVEVTAAINGYAEQLHDTYEFLMHNIWDAIRLSTFELLKYPNGRKLKKPYQLWKFAWDKPLITKEEKAKTDERLKKADKFFPKNFPYNLN